MVPTLLIALLLPDPAVRHEPVELVTSTGTLYGTLDLPTAGGPWPVVLIHAGSGPTDRDGNQPTLVKTDNLRMLGRGLARRGIAALRIDKRGIAASAKAMTKEADLRFDHYIDDAVAWVEWLRKDGRFTKVGVVGHSEGSMIGTVAARKANVDAFVSLSGPGRPLQAILREQLKKNLGKDDYEASERILAELEAGRSVEDVPKTLVALFRPSVQPYLISSFQYDPAKDLAKLTVPILVVAGTTDIQVPPSEGKLLADANPKAKFVEIADMNHILKEVKTTKSFEQQLAYINRDLPLHPALVPTVADFLSAAFGM